MSVLAGKALGAGLVIAAAGFGAVLLRDPPAAPPAHIIATDPEIEAILGALTCLSDSLAAAGARSAPSCPEPGPQPAPSTAQKEGSQ